MSEEKPRKTKTIIEAGSLLHKYHKEDPQKVYIVPRRAEGNLKPEGEIRMFENKDKDGNIVSYTHTFRASFTSPNSPNFDYNKAGNYRVETKEPAVQKLEEAFKAGTMLLVSGQTFKVKGKDKEGHRRDYVRCYVRSIKEAVPEERVRQDNSKWTAYRGGADIIASDDTMKNEFRAAAKQILSGYINFAELNREIHGEDGAVTGYRQTMLVGARGNSTKVEFVTKEQVDESLLEKGKRISMPGAIHIDEYKNKEGKYEKKEVFEPSLIAEYIDREVKKESEPVDEQDESDPDVMGADYEDLAL